MDNRIRLRVLGISYTQLQSGVYALLLAQEGGPYRIPIVVGEAEAQSIAIKLEGITPPRPLTHDLFMSFAQAFGVRLQEVFISRFDDGIFYSEMLFTDGERQVVLDVRTSDAIAIAMRCHAPIWTTPELLTETGFVIENDPTCDNKAAAPADEDADRTEPPVENLAVEELEKLLARLTDEERYEDAARISRLIKEKKAGRQSSTDDNE